MSTVPATAGQTVGLFLRERALPFTLEQHSPHVVLMVHGGFAPSVVAYDLQYRDYSFMAELARAGFDVFALSHASSFFTGGGRTMYAATANWRIQPCARPCGGNLWR